MEVLSDGSCEYWMDDEEGRGVCIIRHWTLVRRTRDGLDAQQLPLMYIPIASERASGQNEPPGRAYPIASMSMSMSMPKNRACTVYVETKKLTFYAKIDQMRFRKEKCYLNAVLEFELENCSSSLLDSFVPVNLQSSCSSVG